MDYEGIIQRLKDVTGEKVETKLSLLMSSSDGIVGMWKKNERVALNTVLNFIEENYSNIDLHWLITGVGERYRTAQSISEEVSQYQSVGSKHVRIGQLAVELFRAIRDAANEDPPAKNEKAPAGPRLLDK